MAEWLQVIEKLRNENAANRQKYQKKKKLQRINISLGIFSVSQ